MSHSTRRHAPRVPQPVRGGIRAQSYRGGFARQWWGRRWLSILEGYRVGARLGRGRNYAYAGQVSALEVAPGLVCATVQGSGSEAYRSELRCAVLTPPVHASLTDALRRRHLLVAKLLVHELPREVDTLFREAGQPLFPERREDLVTHCSCPDWANPCKHLIAVFYLLTEAFDHNPLLLLALRGIRREELLLPPEGGSLDFIPSDPGADPEPPPGPPPFWGAPAAATTDFGTAPATAATAPLARRLGPLPFWRGEERFLDTVALASGRAVSAGWQAWAGERPHRPRAAAHAASPLPRLRSRPRMDVLLR